MFGMAFGEGPGTPYPKLPREALVGAVAQLREAHSAALDRMVATDGEEGENIASVGEAEATNDMMTDLGAVLTTYEYHNGLSLTLSLSQTLFKWSEVAKRNQHAHEEEGPLAELIHASCAPMHKREAKVYITWAYKLLGEWAAVLTDGAAE